MRVFALWSLDDPMRRSRLLRQPVQVEGLTPIPALPPLRGKERSSLNRVLTAALQATRVQLSLGRMTMVVLARYLSLPQGQVAASALRSAGITPFLFDEQQSYARFYMLWAIGGCRLAVLEDDVADAIKILENAADPPVDEDSPAGFSLPTRWLAALFGVGGLEPTLGWTVLALASRKGRWGATWMGILVSVAAVIAAGTVLAALVHFFNGLLTFGRPVSAYN